MRRWGAWRRVGFDRGGCEWCRKGGEYVVEWGDRRLPFWFRHSIRRSCLMPVGVGVRYGGWRVYLGRSRFSCQRQEGGDCCEQMVFGGMPGRGWGGKGE